MGLFGSYARMKSRKCSRIASLYREKASLHKKKGSKIDSEARELKQTVQGRIRRGLYPYALQPILSGAAGYFFDKGDEFDEKARDYESRAASGKTRLPLIFLCSLSEVLKADIRDFNKRL